MLPFIFHTHSYKSDFMTLILSGEEGPKEHLRTDFMCRSLPELVCVDVHCPVDFTVVTQDFEIQIEFLNSNCVYLQAFQLYMYVSCKNDRSWDSNWQLQRSVCFTFM